MQRNPAKYLKRVRIFGCDAYINPRSGNRGGSKNDLSLKLLFIGSINENGPYVFINKDTGYLIRSYHAIFNELTCTPFTSDGGDGDFHGNESLNTADPIEKGVKSYINLYDDEENFHQHQDKSLDQILQNLKDQENLNNEEDENLNNEEDDNSETEKTCAGELSNSNHYKIALQNMRSNSMISNIFTQVVSSHIPTNFFIIC